MSLDEAIKASTMNILSHVHTVLPGEIISFDGIKATVKPTIKRVFSDGKEIELPKIVNVPVVFQKSKKAGVTFELSKGDGVLLLFSEKSLDTWLSKGGTTSPGSNRKFDLSDAIAVPGLFPFKGAEAIEKGFNAFNGDGFIKIDNTGKLTIGNSKAELLDLVDQLLTKLIAAVITTPTGAGSFDPTTITEFTTIKTKLALIKG